MTTSASAGETRIDLQRPASRSADLWRGLDALIGRASVEGIVAHKLGPLAAANYRAAGRPVPKQIADEERAASFAMLSASGLLRRIRDVADGPLVVLKGPELAALYPPNGRRFGDIDVLAPDAVALHRKLKEHGFVEFDERGFDPSEHHHLVPLSWPVVPLLVEVHALPNWPPRIQAPPLDAILEAAVPSTTGIEGLSAPDPLHHALMLAAHAWRHEPLQTLRDLVDVAAMSAAQDRAELERAADAWRIGRIWTTTQRATEALFFGAPQTLPLRLWARHLGAVRERSVFESHLQPVLSPLWGLPPRAALAESARGLHVLAAPAEGEAWGEKLRRIPRAIRDAGVPLSQRRP